MVKLYSLPGTGHVTLATLLAQTTLVLVIPSMTRITGLGCVFILVFFVAGLAFGLGMFSCQFETRLVVIKANLFPVLVHMTLSTILAQTALVLVIAPVTRVTVRRRLAEFFAVLVTLLAFCFPVLSCQRKICLFVVKCLWVKFDYFCIPANVLLVTVTTEFFLYSAVKTFSCFYILADIFMVMALHTSLVLGILFEQYMAL